MSALVKTLNVFPKERSIVSRERTRKAYNVLPYLSGTTLVRTGHQYVNTMPLICSLSQPAAVHVPSRARSAALDSLLPEEHFLMRKQLTSS